MATREHSTTAPETATEPPVIYAPADAMAYAVWGMARAVFSALPAKRKRIAIAALEAEAARTAALTNVYRLRCGGSVKLRETRREAAPVLNSIIHGWKEELR